jgi:hypothetical protein
MFEYRYTITARLQGTTVERIRTGSRRTMIGVVCDMLAEGPPFNEVIVREQGKRPVTIPAPS